MKERSTFEPEEAMLAELIELGGAETETGAIVDKGDLTEDPAFELVVDATDDLKEDPAAKPREDKDPETTADDVLNRLDTAETTEEL